MRTASASVASSSTGLVALLSLILIVAGCLISPQPRAEQAPSDRPLDEPALLETLDTPEPVAAPRSIEQLRAEVAKILEREQVPGVGLALVDRNGVIWAGGVGVADLETGAPVDADTVFRVASITKSVVALGVMRLVEQGRLELDRPLAVLMPEIELENDWADTSPITLAHALEHTAGFDDMRFNEWWRGEDGTRPREALAINPRSRVARWRPGSRMSYSNPGYTIAGHAIELASGEAWDRWLEREVLRPIGMRTASFQRTPALRERLATGYLGPERAAEFLPMAHEPAGSLLASPRELARLVQLGLRRGEVGGARIVSPAGFDRIERTETATHPTSDTNYGLGNYGDVIHPVRGRGHDGGLPGFLSAYRYFPELGVGYVMLLNSTHSARAYLEIRALLFAYLARGRTLPTPPLAPRDPEAIAAVAGHYQFANPRIALWGFVERTVIGLDVRGGNDGIDIEIPTGAVLSLVPTGDGGYRLPQEGGTSVRLGRDEVDGTRVMVIGMSYFEADSRALARARLLALQGALLAMQVSLIWGLAWLLIAGYRRIRGARPVPGTAASQLWPAIASLSFFAMLALFQVVAIEQAFTSRNPLSVALCASTLLFPICSAAAMVSSVRAAGRKLSPRWARLLPSLAATACFGMTLWLLANGIIGLRIWAW